jgi:hypothetical protein
MTLPFDAGVAFVGAKGICAGTSVPKYVQEKWRFLYEELAHISAIILFVTLVFILPLVLLSDSGCVYGSSQALRSIISLAVVLIAGLEILLLFLADYCLESASIRFSVVLVLVGLCVALPFALVFVRCGIMHA